MALILADSRETNGANPYLESCIAENNKINNKLSYNVGGGNISLQIKQITIGDYCIIIKDKNDITKTILAMVIERKTWKDLSASIKDKRIIHQHKSMHNIHTEKGCHVLYIIEGYMIYKDDHKIANVPFKNLHSKIRHNLIKGIPFIQSKNEEHTAKLVVSFARDILKLYRKNEINFTKQIPILQSYYMEIDSINNKYRNLFETNNIDISVIDKINSFIPRSGGDEKEKMEKEKVEKKVEKERVELWGNQMIEENNFSIPVELCTNRIHEDSDIILAMWSSIPGVSSKSAVILKDKFHISDIICSNDINKIKSEISSLKFDSGVKFGEAKANKLAELAYNGDDIDKKTKLYEMSVRIIESISGFSNVTAKSILDQYKLRDICNGFVQADMISEIKNKNGRKINFKSSQKLVDLLIKPPVKSQI